MLCRWLTLSVSLDKINPVTYRTHKTRWPDLTWHMDWLQAEGLTRVCKSHLSVSPAGTKIHSRCFLEKLHFILVSYKETNVFRRVSLTLIYLIIKYIYSLSALLTRLWKHWAALSAAYFLFNFLPFASFSCICCIWSCCNKWLSLLWDNYSPCNVT